jgi:hypothetical protein
MLRLFSPFTVSGRFALMLVVNLIASGGVSAQEHERRGPTLVAPADGSVVDHQFVVRIGFARGGPRGPSEGTGITEGPPPPPADGMQPPRADGRERGPSAGTGLAPGAERAPRAPHFVLLVDAPPLETGSHFKADANHIAFPAGLPQMTLTLPPGQHQLVLQTLDRDGEILQRRPVEPVQVTVKQ